MKISKSFKIITFIFIGFLFVNNPPAYAELLNNLVIHDKPKTISNITFKDILTKTTGIMWDEVSMPYSR